jgi:anti-sigma factor RsiW
LKPDPCEAFADRLVEYADGELPEAEARSVGDHLKTCPRCQELVDAMNKSLGLTRAIWQDAESRPADAFRPVERLKARRRSLRWVGLAAAGLLLAIGIQLTWKQMHRPRPETPVVKLELTPEQAETLAARAGVSAQMLGAAEYLAENGVAELARERLMYLVDAYPETDAAAVARSRLKSERNVR